MTPSLAPSPRLPAMAFAAALAGLSFGGLGSPASAQSAPHYTAKLEQPAPDSRAVAGGVAWMCQGTTCIANEATSRPVRVCRALARKVGAIVSFSAKGEELADDKLAQCNGR